MMRKLQALKVSLSKRRKLRKSPSQVARRKMRAKLMTQFLKRKIPQNPTLKNWK
jgi:hypothetical protein